MGKQHEKIDVLLSRICSSMWVLRQGETVRGSAVRQPVHLIGLRLYSYTEVQAVIKASSQTNGKGHVSTPVAPFTIMDYRKSVT